MNVKSNLYKFKHHHYHHHPPVWNASRTHTQRQREKERKVERKNETEAATEKENGLTHIHMVNANHFLANTHTTPPHTHTYTTHMLSRAQTTFCFYYVFISCMYVNLFDISFNF